MSRLANAPVTVLIVDDSPFMRLTLQKILSQDPGIKVIDTARNGLEGIEKLQALNPQVVTMDVEMPVMDGLQALEEIMRWKPTPVIVLSAITTAGAQATLKALDFGAFEVVAKPSGEHKEDLNTLAEDIVAKVKAAAQVDPSRLGKKGLLRRTSATPVSAQPKRAAMSADESTHSAISTGQRRPFETMRKGAFPKHAVELVAIGTSTGGPSALQSVLPQLPANFPVPVIVAQHMPPGFTRPLAQRLDGLCNLTVREGANGDRLTAGTIYIAPAGKQIQVQRRAGQLILQIGDDSPIATLYRPSVDVMMLSVAKEVGRGALAVIMTGMGHDGLKGVRDLKQNDGFAIAEAEETCVVYGMPRAIVEAGLADRTVPLGDIGAAIVECVQRSR